MDILGVWGLRTTVDRVCSDKGEGGLGVTDMMTRNTCLLLKLLHRLFTAVGSSWATWARGRVCLATLTGDSARPAPPLQIDYYVLDQGWAVDDFLV